MKLSEAKPLDLKVPLSKGYPLKNRLNLVGIELEGGWKTLPKGTALVHDGSVQIPPPPDSISQDQATLGRFKYKLSTGELPSVPMQVKDFPSWMRKYYPSHVNETCGLHIHMSFKSALHYSKLMVPEFSRSMVDYIREWAEEEKIEKAHPIWERLAGTNTACQHLFHADLQALQAQKGHDRRALGHRYTAVGFPYSRHTTIECRLLPMFEDKEVAVRAVQQVINITNASLLILGKGKEQKLQAQVLSDHGSTFITTIKDGKVEKEIIPNLDEMLREEWRLEV